MNCLSVLCLLLAYIFNDTDDWINFVVFFWVWVWCFCLRRFGAVLCMCEYVLVHVSIQTNGKSVCLCVCCVYKIHVVTNTRHVFFLPHPNIYSIHTNTHNLLLSDQHLIIYSTHIKYQQLSHSHDHMPNWQLATTKQHDISRMCLCMLKGNILLNIESNSPFRGLRVGKGELHCFVHLKWLKFLDNLKKYRTNPALFCL